MTQAYKLFLTLRNSASSAQSVHPIDITEEEIKAIRNGLHSGDRFVVLKNFGFDREEMMFFRIEPNMSHVLVNKNDYAKLKADSDMLWQLRNAGVDNWEGYSEALKDSE